MKRMKTIGSLLIVMMIILFSISISGCFHKDSLETVTMMTQAFYAIPGVHNEPHSPHSKFIETDNYGRTLFRFYSGSHSALCILQESDDKYVYYYDNVSFLINSYNYNMYNPDELDALKEANDWNEKLDDSKMIKRELLKSTLSRTRKSEISQKRANESFYTIYPDNDKTMTFVIYSDYSQTGQELFYVERQQNVSTTEVYNYEVLDCYLMILNADGSFDPDNYLIKVDDWDQINTLLAEIKEKNGWVG